MMDQLGNSWWGRINGSLLAGKIDFETVDGIDNTSNIVDETEENDSSFVQGMPENEVFETSSANAYPDFVDKAATGDDALCNGADSIATAEPDQLKTPRVEALMPSIAAPFIVGKPPSSLVRPPGGVVPFRHEDLPETPHWGDVPAPTYDVGTEAAALQAAHEPEVLAEQEIHAQHIQEQASNPEMQDCAQYDVGGPPPAPGGPAVFQGFRPPPSYAWGRMAPVEPVDPPTIHAPEVIEATPAHPSVRKSTETPPLTGVGANSDEVVGSSSGSTGKAEAPSAIEALAQAMDELRRCQNSCSQLRLERRGVPAEDVEHWCASIGSQLRVVCESLEQKLEAQRLRSQTKDETIKRLHRRLQAAEKGAAERALSNSEHPSAVPQSPQSAAAAGLSCGDAASASPSPPPPGALRSGGGTPASPKSPSTKATGAEGCLEATPPPLPSSWPAASMMESPHGADISCSPVALETMAEILEQGGLTASPSQALRIMQTHGHTPSAQPEGRSMVGGRCKRSGVDPAASQKCLTGRPGDKSQQVHLRREVAHLRRRDVDLAGQLRAKETQIEQLTSMMREMQGMFQKQLVVLKRQIHMKDNQIQQLQEETTAGLNPYATPSSAASDGTPASATREARRHRVQQLSGSSSQAAGLAVAQTMPPGSSYHASISAAAAAASAQDHQRSAAGASYGERGRCRGGVTPRPTDCERGRPPNAALSTWPPPGKKEARERSLGAMPHSPRPKGREVPTQTHAPPPPSEGAARRRTSPSSGALARSTSADERRPRNRTDGPAAQRSLRGGAVAGAARGLGRR